MVEFGAARKQIRESGLATGGEGGCERGREEAIGEGSTDKLQTCLPRNQPSEKMCLYCIN